MNETKRYSREEIEEMARFPSVYGHGFTAQLIFLHKRFQEPMQCPACLEATNIYDASSAFDSDADLIYESVSDDDYRCPKCATHLRYSLVFPSGEQRFLASKLG